MSASRWQVLAVIFAARTSMGYQFQAVGSVGPLLVEHLVIDFAMLGTLIGLYKLPGVLAAYPAGLLGQRFGIKRITVWGLALMAVGGLITAYASGYGAAAGGRLIAGTGAVLFNVLSATIVATWFARHELTLAMAIHVNSWPFGIALGLASQALLVEATSLETMLLLTGALCGLGWLAVLLLYADPPPGPEDTGGDAPARAPARLGARTTVLVSLSAMVWLLFNAGLILVLGFTPAFLVAEGLSPVEAGRLASIGTWLGIFTIPLGGLLVQRVGHADLLMTVFLVAGGAAAAMIAVVESWALALVLFGLLAWTPAGPIVALPVAYLGPANRARGLGLFFSYYYLGIGLFAPLAGWLRDVTGEPAAPLLFAATLFLAALAFLGVLRVAEARIPANA